MFGQYYKMFNSIFQLLNSLSRNKIAIFRCLFGKADSGEVKKMLDDQLQIIFADGRARLQRNYDSFEPISASEVFCCLFSVAVKCIGNFKFNFRFQHFTGKLGEEL